MKDLTWRNTPNSFKAQIIGKLLGDGGITKQNGRSPRLRFNHSVKDFEWSLYCYKQLKPYIPLNKPRYRKIKDTRLRKGYSTIYDVQSRVCEIVTYLYKKWYPNSVKTIPFSLLNIQCTVTSMVVYG